jgi:hypothetical protein
MNTTHHDAPALVRSGAGQLIPERRNRPRGIVHRRTSAAVMSNIALALLEEKLSRAEGGFDPYDHRQGNKGGDVWGSKRRD